jgi:hypothetical protein
MRVAHAETGASVSDAVDAGTLPQDDVEPGQCAADSAVNVDAAWSGDASIDGDGEGAVEVGAKLKRDGNDPCGGPTATRRGGPSRSRTLPVNRTAPSAGAASEEDALSINFGGKENVAPSNASCAQRAGKGPANPILREHDVASDKLTKRAKPGTALPPARKPMLDNLTDDEVTRITRSNTRKNSHRNLKARFARVLQTLESLAAAPGLGALPLVRPDTAPLTVSRQNSATGECTVTSAAVGAPIARNESLDFAPSESMEIEPATTECMADFVEQPPLAGRPSVRISTVVSIADLAKIVPLAAHQEVREHPSRSTARVLVPRSQALHASGNPVIVRVAPTWRGDKGEAS